MWSVRPGKELGCLLRGKSNAGQSLRVVLLYKSPRLSLPRQTSGIAHISHHQQLQHKLRASPALTQAGLLIKQRVLLAGLPLSDPHSAAMEMVIPWAIFAVAAAVRAGSCSKGSCYLSCHASAGGWDGSDAPRSDCKSWELCGLHSRVCVCRKPFLPRVST